MSTGRSMTPAGTYSIDWNRIWETPFESCWILLHLCTVHFFTYIINHFKWVGSFFPPRKIFSKRKYSFQKLKFLSPFPHFSTDAQNGLQNRWRLAYYIRGVTLQLDSPQVVGSNPAVIHTFYIVFDTRQHNLVF